MFYIIVTETANTSSELIISLVVAMISSIILFTTIFFVFGCVFGQLWQKRKQSTEKSVSKDTQSQQVEHASSTIGHTIIPRERDLEMTENVAYGPLKCTTIK